jgi:hypothetical protein
MVMHEPLTRPTLVGDVVAERYEIRALLGRGGMGEVYEAVDRRLDRTVALKVLRPELARDRRLLARFRREARTSARLAHPGIVAVHDVGEHGGRAFIVMEFVAGRTLARAIDQQGPMAPALAARIGAEAADALAHAHERGIVHRDVSPGNVMVTPGGAVKILDFGIARAARGSSARSGSPTVHGTAAYVAPEQARGEAADQRADVYALGAVLYELISGRPPLADTTTELTGHAASRTPAPLRGVRPDVPPALEAVVMRCLAEDPTARFVHGGELAAALRTAGTRAAEHRPAPTERAITAPVPAAPARRSTAVLSAPVPRRRRGGRWFLVPLLAGLVLAAGWIAVPAIRSASSSSIRARAHGPAPLPVPSALSAPTSCDGWLSTRAELSWTPRGPSAGYEVWRRQDGDAGYRLVGRVRGWRATSFVDRGLGVDVTYRYVVRSFSGTRVSRPTTEAVAPTPLLCLG